MPMIRERYPDNWEAISKRIRERDGQKCVQCGAPNHATILRSTVNPAKYLILRDDGIHYTVNGQAVRLSEMPDEFDAQAKYTKVVLTVHHVGATKDDGSPGSTHDKMDCRGINLVSLCQRCHFIADLPSHIVSARIARNANKTKRIVNAGQMVMF